jgi:hypothetical protein
LFIGHLGGEKVNIRQTGRAIRQPDGVRGGGAVSGCPVLRFEAEEALMAMQLIDDLPDHVVGVRAIGEVEDDDYDDVLEPAIEDHLSRHDKIRLLYVLGSEFTGYDAEAMWDDTKLGLKTFNSYERMGIVTDATWVRRSVKAFGWLIPGEVRLFHVDELDAARAWIVA